MTNELKVFGSRSQSRSFSRRGWRYVALVVPALILSGCGAKVPQGMLAMDPAEPLPELPATEYEPYDLIMGEFRLTKIPESWTIDVTPRVEGRLYHLRVANASSHGNIGFVAVIGEVREPEEALRAYPFYEGTVTIPPEELVAKYPSEHAIMIAVSKLPSGDPALGGKWLNRQEQERCILASVAHGLKFRRIPTRTTRARFDIFSGGYIGTSGDSPYKFARYRVTLFVDDVPTGLHLFGGFDPPPVSPENTPELIHDLSIAAAQIIEGLEVTPQELRPPAEEE